MRLSEQVRNQRTYGPPQPRINYDELTKDFPYEIMEVKDSVIYIKRKDNALQSSQKDNYKALSEAMDMENDGCAYFSLNLIYEILFLNGLISNYVYYMQDYSRQRMMDVIKSLHSSNENTKYGYSFKEDKRTFQYITLLKIKIGAKTGKALPIKIKICFI